MALESPNLKNSTKDSRTCLGFGALMDRYSGLVGPNVAGILGSPNKNTQSLPTLTSKPSLPASRCAPSTASFKLAESRAPG